MNSKTTDTNTLPRLAAGQCPVCGSAGSLVHFHGEAFPVAVGDLSGTVNELSGDRCQVCEEVFFDDKSAQRFADAGDALVVEARRKEGERLKAVRKRLGLTQGEVGLLVGGGQNGVGRYEKGIADPGPAAFNLMHLLDKNPLLAAELPGVVVTKVNLKTLRYATGAEAKGFKPNKVIKVAGQDMIINVRAGDVLGQVNRAGKRKQVDVSRLVAAKAAAERPDATHVKRAAAKPSVAKKGR